jgi:hypothetical protein
VPPPEDAIERLRQTVVDVLFILEGDAERLSPPAVDQLTRLRAAVTGGHKLDADVHGRGDRALHARKT